MSAESTSLDSESKHAWDQFIYFSGLHYRWERFDEIEREYKLRPARVLEQARDALLTGGPWQMELERASKNQAVVRWQTWDRFWKWLRVNLDDAEAALRVLWTDSELTAA